MTTRIATRQFRAHSEDSHALDGITERINQWLASQTERIRIINIETMRGSGGMLPLRRWDGESLDVAAVQVWYEIEGDSNPPS